MGCLDWWDVWIVRVFGLAGCLDWWGVWIAREFGLMGDLGVMHIEMCPVYNLALSKSRCLIQMAGQNRVKSCLLFVEEIPRWENISTWMIWLKCRNKFCRKCFIIFKCSAHPNSHAAISQACIIQNIILTYSNVNAQLMLQCNNIYFLFLSRLKVTYM